MKRTMLVPVLLAIAIGGSTQATPIDHGKIGVGILLGAPTGVSGKLWLTGKGAFDLSAGWNFQYQAVDIQAGYLYHFPIDVPSGFLAPCVGGGAWVEIAPPSPNPEVEPLTLGGRIPLGLEYIYKSWGFFAELDPLLLFYPGTSLEFGGGIGCRYYF